MVLGSSHPKSSGPARPRRNVLGLFVDWLEDDYQLEVLCGVTDAAESQGCDVLCFAGGGLDSPHRPAGNRNFAFTLASPERLDALTILAGAIGNWVGPEALDLYFAEFSRLPRSTLAVPLRDAACVQVDDARGMREAVDHLVSHHGYRKIAFIRGPEANEEAERRFAVYREVLEESGLPYDPGLVSVGDFQRASGVAAVHQLFEERRREPDAIIAASDTMALGALDALAVRGLRVPMDVAVVGFDDIPEARFASPPLTTVRQPLYEQGLHSANMVLAMLRGATVRGQVSLHTELVTRRSCGCFVQANSLRLHSAKVLGFRNLRDAVSSRREEVLADVAHAVRGVQRVSLTSSGERLLDALVDELGGKGQPCFISELEDVLRSVGSQGVDGNVWQDVLTALRRQLLPMLNSPTVRLLADDLFQHARLVIAGHVERLQARQRLDAERWIRVLSEANEAVIASFDVQAIARAVGAQLPRLGIPSGYLALFCGGNAVPRMARLELAYDSRDRQISDLTGQVFPVTDLLPGGRAALKRRTTLIVLPLNHLAHELGFLLLELGPRQGGIYEALRDEVSAALQGAMLVQQVIEKDRERERLVHDLERRASELEAMNQALRDNQAALVAAEHMASIGRLTASIAHEMNTPVAAVRAALSELERLAQEYRESATDSQVSPADHSEIASEMSGSIRLATRAAERAADFVRSIKNQTRNSGKGERVAFDALVQVRESLLLLGHALRKSNCRYELNALSERVTLVGDPGRFGQVVTNLVGNGIDAMSDAGGGLVELSFVEQVDALELRVRDHGPGVPAELLTQIWEPLFTTKPFGHGTGLGLTIVREILAADFGATISVENAADGGAEFCARFPQGVSEVSS